MLIDRRKQGVHGGLTGLTQAERAEAAANARAVRAERIQAEGLAAHRRPETNRDIPALKGRTLLDQLSSPSLDGLDPRHACRIVRRRVRRLFRSIPKPLLEMQACTT